MIVPGCPVRRRDVESEPEAERGSAAAVDFIDCAGDEAGRAAACGLEVGSFGQLSYLEKDREYPRTQEIAEACCFLGADGILAPSARDPASKNLVIFCEQDTAITKEIVRNHGPIDWKKV